MRSVWWCGSCTRICNYKECLVAWNEYSHVKAMQTADTEDTTTTGCWKIIMQHTDSRSQDSVVGTVTRPGLTNLRHAAFTAVPVFLISIARPASLHCEEWVYTYTYSSHTRARAHTHTHIHIYIYIHINIWLRRDCIWITNVTKLTVRMTHFNNNREQCEVLTGYLSPGRRPGGDWAKTWHWTKLLQHSFQTGNSSIFSYLHTFLLNAFLEENFTWNIIITLCIHNTITIITCINNNTIINNNYGMIQDLIFFIKNSNGH